MAVQPRVSRILLSRASGTREIIATATTQDTSAGSTVSINITQAVTGLGPPGDPDSLAIAFYADNDPVGGARIRSTALLTTSTSQGQTFTFTTTGLSSGTTPAAGTVRIVLVAIKTTGGPTETYNVTSDNTNDTGGTASGAFTFATDQGWIRSTVSVLNAVSNVALGGAKNEPAAYSSSGGDSLFVRTRLTVPGTSTQVATFKSRSVNVRVTTAANATVTTATSASATTGIFDTTMSGVVDNRFSASDATYNAVSDMPTSLLTGTLFTGVFSNAPDTIRVDPRLRRSPLFQLDDDSFGTPPSIKDVDSHKRLVSQQGFLGSRTTNARGEGVNGVTYNVELRADKPGGLITQSGLVTATRGGEAGWSPTLLAWSSSLPSGRWVKSFTITGPSDITGTGYTIQSPGESTEYFLVASDPDLAAVVNAAHDPGLGGRHFTAGMALTVTGYLLNRRTGQRIDADEIDMAVCTFVRGAGGISQGGNKYEYLDTDFVWKPWPQGTPRATHTMAVSPADHAVFEFRVVSDSTWGTRDIRTAVILEFDGVLYAADLVTVNVGPENRHDGKTFDPTGLFS